MSHPAVTHPKELLQKELNLIERFNTKLALIVTQSVGTMWTAYIFTIVAILGGVAIVTNNVFLGLVISLISQTFIQLVLLPVIMVGQNVAQEASEAKAEVDHRTLTYLAQIQDEQLEILRRLENRRGEAKEGISKVSNFPPVPARPR